MTVRSVGARLTVWYAGMFALSMLLLGAAMWLAVQQALYHAVDEALVQRAEGIKIFIEDHKTRLFLDEVKEEFRAHGDLFQVIDDRGQWVYRGAALADVAVPTAAPPGFEPQFEDVSANDAPLRFLTTVIEIDGHTYLVQVAASLQQLQQGLRDSLWLILPLFPLVLLLAAAGGFWMSRRALAPVDDITLTARTITADNLSHRLTVPQTGDELQRLSETLNEMIDRLETAFKRIARFTADASHELRTPLTVMRTTAEVALRGDSSQAAHRHHEALKQIVAEVQRTSHLVENLLILANADSGHERLSRARTDLAAAAREACTEAAVLAQAKAIRLLHELPAEPVWVHGDPNALRRLFLILLDNAIKYTPPGGNCELRVATAAFEVIGTVRDDGVGIPPEHLPLIFERFYRVDAARSRQQSGTGLGLAIGKWIAAEHGGSIEVVSEPGRGSVFEIRIPQAGRDGER
jgi:heavy metal sensor kinase